VRVERAKQGKEEKVEQCKLCILHIPAGGGRLEQKIIHLVHRGGGGGGAERKRYKTIYGTDRYKTAGKEVNSGEANQ
jgi:hypothetical protein